MLTFAFLSENAAGVLGTFGLAGLAVYCAWRFGYKREAWDLVLTLGLLAAFLVVGGFLAMGADG